MAQLFKKSTYIVTEGDLVGLTNVGDVLICYALGGEGRVALLYFPKDKNINTGSFWFGVRDDNGHYTRLREKHPDMHFINLSEKRTVKAEKILKIKNKLRFDYEN